MFEDERVCFLDLLSVFPCEKFLPESKPIGVNDDSRCGPVDVKAVREAKVKERTPASKDDFVIEGQSGKAGPVVVGQGDPVSVDIPG